MTPAQHAEMLAEIEAAYVASRPAIADAATARDAALANLGTKDTAAAKIDDHAKREQAQTANHRERRAILDAYQAAEQKASASFVAQKQAIKAKWAKLTDITVIREVSGV